MTKRHVLVIIIGLIVCGVLFAITISNPPSYAATKDVQEPQQFGNFIVIKEEILTDTTYSQIKMYTMYDPDTMVMYTLISGSTGGLAITVMYNADGTQKLYSPNAEVN